MKLRIASLALLLLSVVVSASATNVYDNGPVNGELDGLTLNYGFAVTDSFTVSNGNGSIGGMDFWAWLAPGDSITSVEVQMGNQPYDTSLFNMVVGLTQSNCFTNMFGYNICMESGTFSGPNLGNGNYWVTLQNAVVPSGDPVYWDVNSGAGCQSPGCPSEADCTGCLYQGSIPSEAFTLTAQGTTSTGETPEPASLLLFGSGFFAVAGWLRRKFI